MSCSHGAPNDAGQIKDNRMVEKIVNNIKYDFNIGYIKKSPCRDCSQRNDLPNCSKGCKKLEQIQTLLIGGVSCNNNFSQKEPYSLYREDT